jgi:hypothetical protein
MDRGEHRVGISVGKLNVAWRDLDRMRSTTIGAWLHRRAQVAPTDLDLFHVAIMAKQMASVWRSALSGPRASRVGDAPAEAPTDF